MKFTELDLKSEILRALTDMGYQDLSPVQETTFSAILTGRDLFARAETGSGKTAACGIPLVQMVNPSLKVIQTLILVPTLRAPSGNNGSRPAKKYFRNRSRPTSGRESHRISQPVPGTIPLGERGRGNKSPLKEKRTSMAW